ncbi:MAG: paraquat-inducible protein A [Pseudomonadota bacterium]
MKKITNSFEDGSDTGQLRGLTIVQINEQYVACPSCDTLWRRPPLEVGQVARCGRCGTVILTNKIRSTERMVAAMVGAIILYVTAISFPFLSMSKAGLENRISVLDAIGALWSNHMPVLAAASALFILVFPVLRMLLLLQIFGVLKVRGAVGKAGARALRWAQCLEPWAMLEIFMIGIIVSLVKVGKLADISVGPSFWALAVLIVVLTFSTTAFCHNSVWKSARANP